MTETLLINEALIALQQGKLQEAKQRFEQILSEEPNQADALHGMGLLYAEQKEFSQSITYFQKAIALAPNVAPFHNNIANAYKAKGKINEALTHYREALKLQPNHANAMNNIGSLLYKQGQYHDAIDMLKKSLRINPEHANTHFNLALCYIQCQSLLEAVSHLKETLKLSPNHIDAMHNLGIALCTLKDFNEAAKRLVKVCKFNPDFDAYYHAGIALAAINQHAQALKYYEQALHLNPKHAPTHHNIAISHLQNQNKDKALMHFERAYALDADNKTALHMLKALKGESSDEGAPPEYTRALFNQYALHYDEHVRQTLKLQVPQLLRQALSPYCHQFKAPVKILDLGCGTGICARYFNDLSDTIVGIDVSENMLIVAKQNGGYHKLVHTDALSYLSQTEDHFEVIIASDTLVYFGKLDALMQACYQALSPNGYFCFSVEHDKSANQNFHLNETGRYQHHQHYIETVAKQSNFKLLSINENTIRQQDDDDIAGLIVVLQK